MHPLANKIVKYTILFSIERKVNLEILRKCITRFLAPTPTKIPCTPTTLRGVKNKTIIIKILLSFLNEILNFIIILLVT